MDGLEVGLWVALCLGSEEIEGALRRTGCFADQEISGFRSSGDESQRLA
jgi:hypothetical protein